jgi:hypothetical protein
MKTLGLWWIVSLLLASPAAQAAGEVTAMPDSRTQEAVALMASFAERTGLTGVGPQQRYLWTDAFAVCNFLGLARLTGEARYRELAGGLVERVHHTLGRHRDDDPRSGWISGLSESEGKAHPTRGGLRIGKRLPERSAGEAFDERLEWDRDGQYFHYLTKWMHALDQLARAIGEPLLNRWARELAVRAQQAFTYRAASAPDAARMYWKMSIDLSHPLVASMGQHDPLDGYLSYVQLQATAEALRGAPQEPELDPAIGIFAAMIEDSHWATTDPLGLGGLLVDAYRVEQLRRQGARVDERLMEVLLTAALAGLQHYAGGAELGLPPEYRLAFRELGLVIGLQAVERMSQLATAEAGATASDPAVRARLQGLQQFVPLGRAIASYWRDPAHQRRSTWAEHRDINEVMLATSLAPEGFLEISPLARD